MKKLVNSFYFLLITGIAAFTIHSFKGKAVNRTPLKISDKFKDVVEEVISVKELRADYLDVRSMMGRTKLTDEEKRALDESYDKWTKFIFGDADDYKKTLEAFEGAKKEIIEELKEELGREPTKQEIGKRAMEKVLKLYDETKTYHKQYIKGEISFEESIDKIAEKEVEAARYGPFLNITEEDAKRLAEQYEKMGEINVNVGYNYFNRALNGYCAGYKDSCLDKGADYAAYGYMLMELSGYFKNWKLTVGMYVHSKKAEELDKEEKGWHETAEKIGNYVKKRKRINKEIDKILDDW